MKILILEDEKFFQSKIIKIIHDIFPSEVEVTLYGNISSCQRDKQQYDLGIIDIMLPDGDGIEYTKDSFDQFDSILFVTSMENRVFEAFGKNVIGFILKENMDIQLLNELKEIKKKYYQELGKITIFETTQGKVRIDIKDIIYIQIENRKIKVVSKKDLYLKRQRLDKLFQKLDERFVQINQSTLINLDCVTTWRKEEIVLNDKYTLYASRKYLKPALQSFMERNI